MLVGRHPHGKPSATHLAGKSAGGAVEKASTAVDTCFECQKPGHLARNFPLNKFPVKTCSQPVAGRGHGDQFEGSFTGRLQPPQQRQQRPQHQQQQQQRPPQHLRQQQRFPPHQAGSTPFSGEERGSGGASTTAFYQRHIGGRPFFLETPGNRELAQRPRFCPFTRPRLHLLRRRR